MSLSRRIVGLLSLLVLLSGTGGLVSAQPFHPLNQEPVGMVDATRSPYGTALNSTTLAAAIAGQAGAPRTLFLKCGTWVMTATLSVPANIRLWVPVCTLVQVNAGVTLTLNSPPLVEQNAWYTGPGEVVLNYVIAPPRTSVGTAGNLQVADGAGGLSAYSGSGGCGDGHFMAELLPTGLPVCGTPVSPSTTGHILTDRDEPLIPQAVNLATRGSGLLQSTVSGAIATISTVPIPAGGLAGLSGPQTLDNTFVPFRVTPLPANVTPLIFDMADTDVAAASELLQNTLIGNPSGGATPARLLWFVLHSTLPRLLTWGSGWSADMGVPLPTSTTGGTIYDALLFQYNANTGKLALLFNTQLVRPQTSGVVAGDYTCPATLRVDAAGRITALTSGACGGGSGTPAGSVGDVQLFGPGGVLAADSGTFAHDAATGTTYTQGMQAGAGTGYIEVRDPSGHTGWLFPERLTGERAWKMQDKSGTVAFLSDVGGGGSVAATGTPTSGQLATWTSPTVLQGVSALPTANFPALTGDCTTTAGSLAVTCAPLKPMTTAGDFIYGGAAGVPTRLPAGTGFLYANGASTPTIAKLARAITLTVGGTTGAALTTSELDYVTVPFACTISAYTLLLDAADTTVRVKVIRVADGGTAIPTVGSNSLNTAGWGVATGTRLRSTTLTDLTSTVISKDDTVGLAVAVANTAKMANLTLQCDQ